MYDAVGYMHVVVVQETYMLLHGDGRERRQQLMLLPEPEHSHVKENQQNTLLRAN